MDYAYGAFAGALVGDSAGSTIEFMHGTISKEFAQAAMRMPGGGVLHVAPGQITDDGELAISLARALNDFNPNDGVPLEEVAKNYVKWFYSSPFDVGNTCRRAFTVSMLNRQLGLKVYLQNQLMQNAVLNNMPMESNGSLMRIVPMAIWSTGQPVNVVAHNAKLDAMLSHPNPVCQDCNALYCIAISELIKTKKTNRKQHAIAQVENYISNNHVHPKVIEWFKESHLASAENLDCTVNIGHVKYGFMLAFYHLHHGTHYEEAILDTLMRGGDTDTNAAIVGGMVGALHGIQDIPSYMKDPVFNFDCTQPLAAHAKGHTRERIYSATLAYELTKRMLKTT